MRIIKIVVATVSESEYKIKKTTDGQYLVTKSDGSTYDVSITKSGNLKCTCTGYQFRHKCKHTELVKQKYADKLNSQLDLFSASEIQTKIKSEPVRHPRHVIEAFIPKLRRILDKYGKWEVVGSYRRNTPTLMG